MLYIVFLWLIYKLVPTSQSYCSYHTQVLSRITKKWTVVASSAELHVQICCSEAIQSAAVHCSALYFVESHHAEMLFQMEICGLLEMSDFFCIILCWSVLLCESRWSFMWTAVECGLTELMWTESIRSRQQTRIRNFSEARSVVSKMEHADRLGLPRVRSSFAVCKEVLKANNQLSYLNFMLLQSCIIIDAEETLSLLCFEIP